MLQYVRRTYSLLLVFFKFLNFLYCFVDRYPNILLFVNRYVGRLTSRNVIICTIFLFSMKKIPIRIPNPDSIRITKPYPKSLIGYGLPMSCAQKVLISIFQHRCKFYLNGFKVEHSHYKQYRIKYLTMFFECRIRLWIIRETSPCLFSWFFYVTRTSPTVLT